MHTIGFLGFDGGRLRDLLDDCVIVPCADYGHVESAHLVLGHLLTQWLHDRLEEHSRRPPGSGPRETPVESPIR
jgi:hypothetical protein